MDNLEVIRVTSAADITGIPATEADVLLVVDRATTVAAATCPFPAVPRHRQVFGISTRVQITALTLDPGPGAIPISGYTGPFQLNANTIFWRIYDLPSNRWFPY